MCIITDKKKCIFPFSVHFEFDCMFLLPHLNIFQQFDINKKEMTKKKKKTIFNVECATLSGIQFCYQ